jgi:hypothetical protein
MFQTLSNMPMIDAFSTIWRQSARLGRASLADFLEDNITTVVYSE